MAIAALVLGILAVVFAFGGPWAWVGIIAGIIGIILAVMARKQAKTGQATAGLVLSIIGLVLSAILWLACVMCVSGVKKGAEELIKNNPELQKSVESLKDLQNSPELQKGLEELNKALEDVKQ